MKSKDMILADAIKTAIESEYKYIRLMQITICLGILNIMLAIVILTGVYYG